MYSTLREHATYDVLHPQSLAKRASDIADSWTPEGVPVNVHDDSFSDDEVLHGSMNVSHLSDHNTSWIK